MDTRVEDLLAAPLGRQLLYSALGFPTFELYGRCGLGTPPGATMLVTGAGARPVPLPVTRSRWAEVPELEARRVIAEMVAVGRWRTLERVSELELLSWLAAQTGSFGFRGEDEWLWGLTARAAQELVPVADLLLSCPAAQRWWRPLVRHDQRVLVFDGAAGFVGQDLQGAISDATARHKSENTTRAPSPRDERKRLRDEARGLRHGARWWSAPTLPVHAVSVGPFAGIPSIELLDFVDSGSRSGPATVTRFATHPDANIFEVHGPRDWAALVERYPMDATATHDGEWRYWGGVRGPWLLPDWLRVSADFDGVHVTIGGYVTSCGRALPVGTGYTMLAGWVPDGTQWLTDASGQSIELGTWDFFQHGAFPL